MKSFIAICICIVVATQAHSLTKEELEKVKTYKTDCAKDSGVSAKVAEDTNKGVFPADPKLKEFLFCLSKKVGYLNDTGDFQLTTINDKVTANHGQETARDVVAPCTQKKGSSGQETSLALAKCFYEKSKQHIALA
ncbi:PREDICTED: general odorant-binding protein 69a-like [Nicrophorus vespilloides]|uniref:General odorant-binding protein 69a-like n=1 Tax=Nicrophorus vespilloides TaxID=110193 RepID=A0ABM1N893_NICVS|nr:PREDICTED: general odorant-binding protein 69a-like [Nicrophorus vespilloides]